MKDIVVSAVDVWLAFGKIDVLKGVSLSVGRGEVLALLGPSGSGKSSLLRCLNRLNNPYKGQISIAGIDMMNPKTNLPNARARIGFVSQHFNLYPHKTAIENVMEAPMIVLKENKTAARERSLALLEQVGLADKAASYPRQLSGGQQQRVAIARALAMNPDVILFDEPTSALDPELKGEVLDTIVALAKRNLTMVVVTHEMQFARNVASQIQMMADGEVIEGASPEVIFSNPTHRRTQQFLEKVLRWEE